MANPTSRSALITGGSAGLGAAYADHLARRGHDIVLVARDKARLDETAHRVRTGTGRDVSVLSADLSTPDGTQAVEERIAADASIDTVVNNAGIALFGPLSSADPGQLDRLVAINVGAFTRIAAAAARTFARRGRGTLINISSALAVYVMPVSAAQSAAKSYVLTFTQALAQEFADSPVRVQAVLPGFLRTTWWDGSGFDLGQLPDTMVMTPEDAAAAGLAGLDSGELITIPSLADAADWQAYDDARANVAPRLSSDTPAARYRS
jgi:uncharacterized protein